MRPTRQIKAEERREDVEKVSTKQNTKKAQRSDEKNREREEGCGSWARRGEMQERRTMGGPALQKQRSSSKQWRADAWEKGTSRRPPESR